MIFIAVCDDEPLQCANIAKEIETILKHDNVEACVKRYFSSHELISSNECFDIVFLDIKMPGINGMELAKDLRKQGKKSIIIFITSAKEYVFEAYDVEAFRFLIKPVQIDKMKGVLRKAVKKICAACDDDFLLVSSDRQTKKLLLKDILYIESTGRNVKIHYTGNIIDVNEQIGVLEKKLINKHFFRCHKCYLVNLDCIDTFDKTDITMENGDNIMLAKRRCEAFKKEMLSYMKTKGGII